MDERPARGPQLSLAALGVGAANSPRFAPAGLLVELGACRVMLDGGPGSAPLGPVTAWLVTDERSELIARIRSLARALSAEPQMADVRCDGLAVEHHPVVHTGHPTCGYLIRAAAWRVGWAAGADLMFAEAAGWDRPIRFARGTGGHLHALAVAEAARASGVRQLLFAHIGRPTIRAMDRGQQPPFGRFATEGEVLRLPVAG